MNRFDVSMELRHLRYFLALSEELHFGRAAQRLGLSQPPLSVAVQQLEAAVGAPLFIRSSRGVQLTAAGEAFVPAAQAVLDRAAQALVEARDVAVGEAGSLRIGFAGTMLYRGLPLMLQRFQAEHPRLKISLRELSSSEQLLELQHDRLDAGFAHTTQVPSGLSQILVSSQPFVACVPGNHTLARQRTVPLEALAGQPFALVARAVSPDYHSRILMLCGAAGFTPEPAHELQHWLSVVSLVGQGLAVALVPAAMQQAGMAGVAFLPVKGTRRDWLRYETHCLWKAGRDQPALGLFLSAVGEVAANR
ncbi:DNA-binding transcriptional LysR family regulator [Ottowia thiooxydans]|uniref:DNA-binding transcriptional LysR family regulator n=2 Tax=Ottowia thiooxydans TaxID=219182 RepID=A0ABV2Q435_9BURK